MQTYTKINFVYARDIYGSLITSLSIVHLLYFRKVTIIFLLVFLEQNREEIILGPMVVVDRVGEQKRILLLRKILPSRIFPLRNPQRSKRNERADRIIGKLDTSTRAARRGEKKEGDREEGFPWVDSSGLPPDIPLISDD